MQHPQHIVRKFISWMLLLTQIPFLPKESNIEIYKFLSDLVKETLKTLRCLRKIHYFRYRCLLPMEIARYQTVYEIAKDILEQQGNKFHQHFRLGEQVID